MKDFLKNAAAAFLALLAGVVLAKYRPKVVMVTGSVGKTSTREAIKSALSTKFYVRGSQKSYNNEFGVPLTILGCTAPGRNLLGWLKLLKEAFALIFLPNHYPNLVVLEVGADRPGDLAKILNIATPDVVVVTRLPDVPVHVEAYATPEAVREEEFSPAYALAPGKPLIISADDEHAVRMAKRIPARVITSGEAEDAHFRVTAIRSYLENGLLNGVQGEVESKEGKRTIVVKGSIGEHQVLPVVAALAAASALGISLDEALSGLEKYVPPPGRGRIFNGKKGSVLIDDTYNSSPAAVEKALGTLSTFPGKGRRVAVLGDMLELGRYSVTEHARMGKIAVEVADMVVSVGIRAKVITDSARAAGFPQERLYSFDDSAAAASIMPDLVQEGDVVLIKGSQSIRTEKIVEALLADPMDAPRLVRQEREWKTRA